MNGIAGGSSTPQAWHAAAAGLQDWRNETPCQPCCRQCARRGVLQNMRPPPKINLRMWSQLSSMLCFYSLRAYFCIMYKWMGWLALALLIMPGCDKEQEAIPAYLHLDSFSLKPTALQGNNIHKLQGVQVEINGRFMGNFPLPCDIPVIANGQSKVRIQAAVLANGSANVWRPFLSVDLVDTTVLLEPQKTTVISAIPVYFRPNCKMEWLEDFEDNGSTLVPYTDNSKEDTMYIRNVPFELNGKFAGNTKALYMRIEPSDSVKYFDIRSFTYFNNLPIDGRDIYLEFDIKGNDVVSIGLQRKSLTGEEYVPYLTVKPEADIWKRFYANLVYEIAGQPATNEYRLVFTVVKSNANSGAAGEIYMDNFRMTYLQ